MNQTRSFLLIAWLVLAGVLWMEWNRTQAPPPVTTSETPTSSASNAALPATGANALPAAAALPGAATAAATPEAASQPITIANDTLRLTVDLHGGRLLDAQLLQYTLEKKPGSPNLHLFTTAPGQYYVADAGLISVDDKNVQHELVPQFRTESGARDFVLAPGAEALRVPLVWTDSSGVTVRRTLTLKRGSYVLELSDQVSNAGAARSLLYPFVSLSRVAPPAPPKHSFMTSPDTFSFVGAAWYTPEDKFKKAKLSAFTSETPPTTEITGGWIAMVQHHFVTAWVPAEAEHQRFDTTVASHNGAPLYRIRDIAAPLEVAPGTSRVHDSRLWIGPKVQRPMAAVAPSLKLTVDYGIFTFIAQPLFWLLSELHLLFGNWGWAIIAIVVLLKLALYPLSAKQYQSMAKMRAVQPRIEALKERYGDDKQALNVAMFELYKKEKVNPAAGCWPILVQMPIFLGLYWVLLNQPVR